MEEGHTGIVDAREARELVDDRLRGHRPRIPGILARLRILHLQLPSRMYAHGRMHLGQRPMTEHAMNPVVRMQLQMRTERHREGEMAEIDEPIEQRRRAQLLQSQTRLPRYKGYSEGSH